MKSLDEYKNKNDLIHSLINCIDAVTKVTLQLPGAIDPKAITSASILPLINTDFEYFKTNSEYSNELKNYKNIIYDIMNSISEIVGDCPGSTGDLISFNDTMSSNVMHNNVVNLLNKLLDDANIQLDNFSRDEGTISNVSILLMDKDSLLQNTLNDIQKPQLEFAEDDIDNSRDVPFHPKLPIKYHSLLQDMKVDLQLIAEEIHDAYTNSTIKTTSYQHPYLSELKALEYQSWQLIEPPSNPMAPSKLLSHQVVDIITSEEVLHEMIEQIIGNDIHELAVDLEHHSYRSFQGLTCLLQISTRYYDYIIDTLALRRSLFHLNKLFCNPAIVKVFHGCDNDILWLQKDCGIYVINCFDTYQAAKLLRYPNLSLAYLIQLFCNIHINKQYQLADWRQRPLSREMLFYAQSDTHYLLFIYDRIRRELWDSLDGSDSIELVLNMSKKVCFQKYDKERFNPLGYKRIIYDTNRLANDGIKLNDLQEHIMKTLYDWRDKKARDLDESSSWVLSNSNLIKLSKGTPCSMEEIKAMDLQSHIFDEELSELINSSAISFDSLESSKLFKHVELFFQPINKNTILNMNLSSSSFPVSTVTSPNREGGNIGLYEDTSEKISSPTIGLDDVFQYAGWVPSARNSSSSSRWLDDSMHSTSPSSHQGLSFESLAAKDIHHQVDILSKINTTQSSFSVSHLNSRLTSAESLERDNFISQLLDEDDLLRSKVQPFDDSEILSNLPQSLQEIYQISNQLRKKKLDKKRFRGDTDDVNSSTHGNSNNSPKNSSTRAPIDEARLAERKLQDESIYMQYAAQLVSDVENASTSVIDKDIETMLDTAESVGWIKDSFQREVIKASHFQDVLSHSDNMSNSNHGNNSSHGNIYGNSTHGGSSSIHGSSIHSSSIHGSSTHGSSIHGSSIHGVDDYSNHGRRTSDGQGTSNTRGKFGNNGTPISSKMHNIGAMQMGGNSGMNPNSSHDNQHSHSRNLNNSNHGRGSGRKSNNYNPYLQSKK